MTAQVVGCWAATEWMASLPAVETDAAAAPAALAAPAAVRPAAPDGVAEAVTRAEAGAATSWSGAVPHQLAPGWEAAAGQEQAAALAAA